MTPILPLRMSSSTSQQHYISTTTRIIQTAGSSYKRESAVNLECLKERKNPCEYQPLFPNEECQDTRLTFVALAALKVTGTTPRSGHHASVSSVTVYALQDSGSVRSGQYFNPPLRCDTNPVILHSPTLQDFTNLAGQSIC
jgi:hypothetical protein